jgi:hypothetical protein
MFADNLLITSYPYNINKLGEQAFRGCKNLVMAPSEFLNIQEFGYESFYGASKITGHLELNATKLLWGVFRTTGITGVTLHNIPQIYGSTFQNTPLKLLINDRNVLTPLDASAFTSTPIADGTGFIYVPDALYNAYLIATNWATYASQIKKISELNE